MICKDCKTPFEINIDYEGYDIQLCITCNKKNEYQGNDNKTACDVCNKIKSSVRFEGDYEGFICDGCLYEKKKESYKND